LAGAAERANSLTTEDRQIKLPKFTKFVVKKETFYFGAEIS